MELEVLGHTGIPDSGIISIRAGSTRRQAQLCLLDRPLKFPQGPSENNFFKVDVLDLLGSSRIAYNPEESEYKLCLEPALEGGADPNIEVSFRLKAVGAGGASEAAAPPKALSAEDQEKALDQKKEAAAREYLEKHGLTSFMQFLMQSLMKDKPSDPYSFLQKQVTKRMVTEVSRAVVGDKVSLLPEGQVDAMLQEVTPDQLKQLEEEAAAAGEQLRADNEKLRETADKLKSKYGKLIEQSNAPQVEAAEVPAMPPLPPPTENESAQMVAYREIASMQDEVTSLARENATLVMQLSNMRESIESVRDEIAFMNQDTPGRHLSVN